MTLGDACAPRVVFDTLGCRSNYADTVNLQSALVRAGGVPTQNKDSANVYVLNTCSVTDAADKTAFRMLRKIRRDYPSMHIVVTGCLAKVGKDALLSSELVDLVASPTSAKVLAESIMCLVSSDCCPDYESQGAQFASVPDDIPGPGSRMGDVHMRSRYNLRVQDGCENYCTYCIVPQTRGLFRSRSVDAIVNDIERLEAAGYEEIVLSGTNLGSYGRDTGVLLIALLEEIIKYAPSARIRLSSIDPDNTTRDIISLVAQSSVYCEHLHLSVQSFSSRVLKRMRRRYVLEDVEDICRYAASLMPRCSIGADIIAGFPGESREEVDQATESFLGLPFSYLHVFPYSERAGTAAVKLDGVVDGAERQRRSAHWRLLGRNRREEFHRSLIGSKLEVIVENRIEEGVFAGTSREYAAVCVKGLCVENYKDAHLFGKRVLVRASEYDAIKKRIVCELLSPERLAV